jgi:5'-nucleotidase
MTIVLTNDDGVNATGIGELGAALAAAGLPVVVVAPEANQSGVSRAATYTNPVRVARAEGAGPGVFSVAGTPVDCVRVALGGGLVPDASLVISGINHGCNAGDDMFNSGTVGAAIESALFGVPAMAISQQSLPGHFSILEPVGVPTASFRQSTRYGVALARALLDRPTPGRTVLNVNVPAQPATGISLTRLGKRFNERNSLAPVASRGPATYYLVYGSSEDQPVPYETAEGTDFAALRDGLVSVTPVSYEHDPLIDDGVGEWAEALLADARSHLAV